MTRNRKLLDRRGGHAVAVIVAVVLAMHRREQLQHQEARSPIFSRVQTRDAAEHGGAHRHARAASRSATSTAANEGLVSSVTSTDGDVTQAGQTMFALNGRNAVAEPGSLPFFRSLAPGDQGADVLELKQILAAAGDYPGPDQQLLHPADPVRPGPVAGPAPLPELDARPTPRR